MKRVFAMWLLVLISIPALALVEGNDVVYGGGTVAGLKPGAVGQLNLTSSKELNYTAGATKIAIPYSSIRSFYYAEQNAHRLGVLPTIAAGLVAARMKRHFFYVSYLDGAGEVQTLTLEGSRDARAAMQMAIEARIPKSICRNLPGSC